MMKKFSALFVLALVVCAIFPVHCEEEEAPTEEAVLVLTNSNFDKTISSNEIVLVKFYAPWCGHCKRMAPEYEKAATTLKENGNATVLGKVDATSETELANKYQINEYPTLMLFRDGVPEKYNGGRTSDGIIQWVEKMTGPAVQEVEGDVNEVIEKDGVSVAFVGEFKSKDDEMYKIFNNIAKSSRQSGGKFYCRFGKDETKIYVNRKDEGESEFKGKTEEELSQFVQLESFYLLGPINGENYNNYDERDFEMVWFCGNEEDYNNNKKEIREAAKDFRKEFSFVWIDTDHFKGYVENSLRVTSYPGLVYQTKKGARYILPDAPESLKDSKVIVKFLNDVKEGKIERDIKSEPIPDYEKDEKDTYVKTVVGKNFEKMIIQDSKDVMIEIYAPWCGYCKSFEPIYNEFAEKIKDVDHVLITKMDGIANDSPLDDFQYNSFPTIYFVKAGEKKPMKFEGPRTVDGLIEYVKKHASKPVTLTDKHDEL